MLLIQQLPESYIPAQVSGILEHCMPSSSQATNLMSDCLSPVEWTTCRHVLTLFREALAPTAAAANGLTLQALAGAVVEYWFGSNGAGVCVCGGGGGTVLCSCIRTLGLMAHATGSQVACNYDRFCGLGKETTKGRMATVIECTALGALSSTAFSRPSGSEGLCREEVVGEL